jgi:hypothetical protein
MTQNKRKVLIFNAFFSIITIGTFKYPTLTNSWEKLVEVKGEIL